ncbi:MAG: PQQ-binding-like beta-propeller repeat protein [Planctomycetes bacterium]|nr:PQQ-binding-like beta-propeller repeat protein [Planctomycetota bacterium]
MNVIAVLALSAAWPCQAAPAGQEHVVLLSREEFTGQIREYRREGVVILQDGERTRSIPIEDVARILFEPAPAFTVENGEKLRLQHGGLLTGAKTTYADGEFSIETAYGRIGVRRDDVRSVSFAPLDGNVPELKDDTQGILIWKPKDEGKTELKADYGELTRIDADLVVIKNAEGKATEVPRAAARVLYMRPEAKTRSEMPAGWFVKALLKNGDKIVGVLRAIEPERITLFSHLLGIVSVKKPLIHSLTFVQYPRMSVGNIVLCEQNGVRELDRAGREIWRYQNNVAYPWAARKLDNGHVLIANTNYNQVLEVRPRDKVGGDVVWQLDNVNYPYDVRRLEDGHTLVAEYYGNRVSEFEPKNKTVVWQTGKCNYPISAQRLENGNTLICSTYQIVEINEKQEEKWRATVTVRPWRAERLDNGNTLIVDQQRGVVLEIDPKNVEIWRKESLSRPNAAVRLDDGNTLILEQGKNQIIDVDPAGKTVNTITGLNYPLHISSY